MQKGKLILGRISFNPKTSLANKKKINFISFYLRDENAAFTCLNLFPLTSYNAFLVINFKFK